MPKFGKEYIYAGLVEGLDKAVTNYINIQQASKELETQDEKDKLDLKIRGLQLKKAEHDLDPDVLAAEQEKLKAATQAQKVQNQLNSIKIKGEERKIRKDIEATKNIMLFRNKFMRGEETELPAGVSYSSSGAFSVSGRAPEDPLKGVTKFKKAEAQKAIIKGFIKEQEDTQGIQKSAVGAAKDFFVKPKATELLERYGKTKDDVYDWAKTNSPDLARVAFPGRALLETKRGVVGGQ